MTEAKELRDYVDAMTLPPGSGLTRAKLELAKVSGGLTDELNLDQLNLTDEDMKVLIGPISKLGKNLRVLKLFLNELTSLPVELGLLTELEELRAGCNPLVFVPEEIFENMKSLRYLDIGYGDALTDLPESIGECSSLQELWVGNNRITQLPSTLWNCSELEVLQVYGNDLKTISVDLGKLKRLRVLNMGRNQVSTLPDSIEECKALTDLHVYENDLRSIPESITRLPELKVFNGYGNPRLSLPPREILRKGITSILKYYASRDAIRVNGVDAD